MVGRLDDIRTKLERPTSTNARRLTAPGIGVVGLVAVVAFAALLACSPDSPKLSVADSATAASIARAKQDSINRAQPGYVVDSILPVDEELRRFRAAIGGDSVSTLEDGAQSRDALVKMFIRALSTSDSVTLRKMLLNAREFAWLVYPESPYTHPPYTQAPALVWNQIENPAASGLSRLISRLGGKALQYQDYECAPRPDHQGKNAIWTKCTLRLGEPGESIRRRRLFGSIIERDGRFKFVSYVNEF